MVNIFTFFFLVNSWTQLVIPFCWYLKARLTAILLSMPDQLVHLGYTSVRELTDGLTQGMLALTNTVNTVNTGLPVFFLMVDPLSTGTP